MRGIKTVYGYDNRDRVTKVSSTNVTVTYSYAGDGDGNAKSRTDVSGTMPVQPNAPPPAHVRRTTAGLGGWPTAVRTGSGNPWAA
ncbi:hypothetical protein AB0G20_27765 [Streptomyces sp. NPDC024017]|uniref:hypothetical protein n=1 Tax=Streptomyces sp. NPDC024017 TaxID=3154326 RepID=UPI0033D2EEA5